MKLNAISVAAKAAMQTAALQADLQQARELISRQHQALQTALTTMARYGAALEQLARYGTGEAQDLAIAALGLPAVGTASSSDQQAQETPL